VLSELLCTYNIPTIDVFFEFHEKTLETQITKRSKSDRPFSKDDLTRILRAVLLAGCHFQMLGEAHPDVSPRSLLVTAAGQYKLANVYAFDDFIDQKIAYHFIDAQVARLVEKEAGHEEVQKFKRFLDASLQGSLVTQERKHFYWQLVQDYIEKKVDINYMKFHRQRFFEEGIRENVIRFGFLLLSAGTLTPFEELLTANESFLSEKMNLFRRRYPDMAPLLEQKILLYKEKRKIPMFDELLRFIMESSGNVDLAIEDPEFKPRAEPGGAKEAGHTAYQPVGTQQNSGQPIWESRPPPMRESIQRVPSNQIAQTSPMAVAPGAPTSVLSNLRNKEPYELQEFFPRVSHSSQGPPMQDYPPPIALQSLTSFPPNPFLNGASYEQPRGNQYFLDPPQSHHSSKGEILPSLEDEIREKEAKNAQKSIGVIPDSHITQQFEEFAMNQGRGSATSQNPENFGVSLHNLNKIEVNGHTLQEPNGYEVAPNDILNELKKLQMKQNDLMSSTFAVKDKESPQNRLSHDFQDPSKLGSGDSMRLSGNQHRLMTEATGISSSALLKGNPARSSPNDLPPSSLSNSYAPDPQAEEDITTLPLRVLNQRLSQKYYLYLETKKKKERQANSPSKL
jgi:hypothetical protein